MMDIDPITKTWIRNAADQRAAENGCKFDEARGQHACDFVERYLVLYEGEYAGEPFKLMPWQRDVLMRAFGWVRYSEFHKRDVRRFRKVSVFVSKKNGKSPLAAAVGLYLLLGDGERGQKVFSAAKDGRQAAIVHTHAQKMVESSPSLSAKCKINRGTGRISYLPTSSNYDILSGDNIQGQEGLNGSAVVDETHVVDDRLARVLEHMGASRAEPMQFEVSTAGNNPLSYGRKEYEYGHAVNNGTFPDDTFLFIEYAAPQDATDDELNDPEVWKAANPSWGVTINEEEFRAAFNKSKRSLADWTDFKRYRLGIWANSANPFIKAADWQKCRHDFTEGDLIGQQCVAGLDLARKQDLTALVLLFGPYEDGTFRVLSYFWLPENRAKELDGQVPYLQWAKEGHITLIDGDVMDFKRVAADIKALAEKFDIRSVVYDPMFAEELTQDLAETGIERIEFGQKLLNFAKPTAEFESLVIDGKLHHAGHPILSWQIGHVMAKESSGLMRPVRPLRGDARTIDGVVALVMAIDGAMGKGEDNRSVYERENRGFLILG